MSLRVGLPPLTLECFCKNTCEAGDVEATAPRGQTEPLPSCYPRKVRWRVASGHHLKHLTFWDRKCASWWGYVKSKAGRPTAAEGRNAEENKYELEDDLMQLAAVGGGRQ